MRRALWIGLGIAMLAAACPFDGSLREYLSARFWMPFAKQAWQFERKNVQRIDEPFAGMTKEKLGTPLGKLRLAYQGISQPINQPDAAGEAVTALAAAKADASLTPREREEVELLDAKIDLRLSGLGDPAPLNRAKDRLEQFLRTAQTPELRSEARGWLGRAYYLLGDQTAAGKIYLDELNRNGSNLGRSTILTSLRLTYGYDGGEQLRAHLADYFDTPEHAAFAISMATNSRWERTEDVTDQAKADTESAKQYTRIRDLLAKHDGLFRGQTGSGNLALLTMRVALRMGDPPEALRIAEMVPAGSGVRQSPDFQWMSGSAQFLAHRYTEAEAPLLALFTSKRATRSQQHAAAYALSGVYRKTSNTVEQIRFALWLQTGASANSSETYGTDSDEDYMTVYWDPSGWDLDLLLDSEASIEDLRAFAAKYPNARDVRMVWYSLAVRLARANQYRESAAIYQQIGALRRALRMRKLAELDDKAQRQDLAPEESQQARYELAKYIGENEDRLYFNDRLWGGLQRYALKAEDDSRFTREEREIALRQERDLKDEQEERWRAYQILRDVMRDAGHAEIGRNSARLALDDLLRISERFGRKDEIAKDVRELRAWLRDKS